MTSEERDALALEFYSLIEELKAAGIPPARIADVLEVNSTTVQRWMREPLARNPQKMGEKVPLLRAILAGRVEAPVKVLTAEPKKPDWIREALIAGGSMAAGASIAAVVMALP